MTTQRFPWSGTTGESSTIAADRFWKLLALLCLCLHCRTVACHSWFRVPNPHNVSLEHRPTLDVQSECPSIKIAVINGVNFHFEVLASVFTVLMPYAQYVDVFLSPYAQTANFNGAWDLVHWFPATYKKAIPSAVVYGYDMVLLISTDYEMQTNIDLVELMKPQLLLAYIHNAQFPLGKLLALAPNVKVLTLSPHVADSVRRYSNQTVDWMLPVYPLQPTDDCLTFPKRWVLGLCLRGFALQGKFSNLRRNYTGIWKQMAAKLTIMQDPQVGRVFHVNVLGKGEDRLALPQALEMHVNVHRRLLYNQFFNAIAHNVGLIPSLANSKYYTEKFSSTILASLITGTPVLAEEKLMRAYTFLTPDAVYLAREGEPEVDAMLRIATWKAEDILKVRLALLMLRERLNQRAGQMMEGYIRQACEHVKQLRPIVTETGPTM